jgi:predicted nucleic acid-binding protein
LIAVDSSVVVAAFATWHESHAQALAIVAGHPALPAPVTLEAYAVLTRLPAPHRAEGAIVRDFLVRAFPTSHLRLPPSRSGRLIDDLVALGIAGGATYDAVIALTAVHHRCQLATLDARARPTYERVGASVVYLGRTSGGR